MLTSAGFYVVVTDHDVISSAGLGVRGDVMNLVIGKQ